MPNVLRPYLAYDAADLASQLFQSLTGEFTREVLVKRGMTHVLDTYGASEELTQQIVRDEMDVLERSDEGNALIERYAVVGELGTVIGAATVQYDPCLTRMIELAPYVTLPIYRHRYKDDANPLISAWTKGWDAVPLTQAYRELAERYIPDKQADGRPTYPVVLESVGSPDFVKEAILYAKYYREIRGQFSALEEHGPTSSKSYLHRPYPPRTAAHRFKLWLNGRYPGRD